MTSLLAFLDALPDSGESTARDASIESSRNEKSRWIAVKLKHRMPEGRDERAMAASKDIVKGSFEYDLRLDGQHDACMVRLLRLLPDHRDAPIHCELVYTSLDDGLSYEALSYCWGDEIASQEIQCDQKTLHISNNLALALRTLRKSNESLLLWVDAICIDQTSIAEKNNQIPLMKLIYGKASTVRIWLGDDPSQTAKRAFKIISALQLACAELGWEADMIGVLRRKELHRYDLPDILDPLWQEVGELLCRPWFGRAWVVQELLVAKHAVLHAGDTTMSWRDFYIGLLFGYKSSVLFALFRSLSLDLMLGVNQCTELLTTYRLSRELDHLNTTTLDLFQLLIKLRSAQASDPRDKIFAFLGLSDVIDHEKHGLKPDYGRTTAATYTAFAARALECSDQLDILSIPRIDADVKTPSWVPDWSGSDLSFPFCLKKTDGTYALSFDASHTSRHAKHLIIHGHTFQLSGFVFDTITELGNTLDTYPSYGSTDSQKRSVGPIASFIGVVCTLESWKEVARLRHKGIIYPTGEDIHEVHLQCTCAGHFNASSQARDMILRKHKGERPRWNKLLRRVYEKLDSEVFRRAIFAVERRASTIVMFSISNLADGGFGKYGRGSLDSAKAFHRRMMRSTKGYLGLAPKTAQVGDSIVLVKGGRVPLVLRQRSATQWQLIGDAYVHGIMHGEAFEEDKCSVVELI